MMCKFSDKCSVNFRQYRYYHLLQKLGKVINVDNVGLCGSKVITVNVNCKNDDFQNQTGSRVIRVKKTLKIQDEREWTLLGVMDHQFV